MTRLLPALLALAVAAPALAGPLEDGRRCLDANDVPCAEAAVATLHADTSTNPALLAFAAETAFYDGRFDEAQTLLSKAVDAGWEDRWDDLPLYERTVEVTKAWTTLDGGRFVLRYLPGIDEVLLADAQTTLADAERTYVPLLGAAPPGHIAVEIYPDGRSFIAASSLTADDVRTTGVVALSKWSRLLITSPRALGRGYAWKDTVAHEYIHLVVAYQTDDKAPVWLQEAIAKYLDNRWHTGRDGFRLSVESQGQLAKAIKDDRFVSFDDMHPSLAKLPSADLATLAYAQLATLMQFCFQEGGEDLLLRVLPKVKAGVDPRIALAEGAGYKSFDALEKAWRAWVATLPLRGDPLAAMPTVLDGGDAVDADPILAERKDLARYLRLGDLLRERLRFDAALIEYHKALPSDGPVPPLLANRIGQSHIALGQLGKAREALEESLETYPEFPLTHKTLGEVLRKQGETRAAIASYERAADLNPFDPDVQLALSELYRATGDTARAAAHEGYLRILRPGGHGKG